MVEVIIGKDIAFGLKPSIQAIVSDSTKTFIRGSAVARAHALVCASGMHIH